MCVLWVTVWAVQKGRHEAPGKPSDSITVKCLCVHGTDSVLPSHAPCSFVLVDVGWVSYFFDMKIDLTTCTKSQPDLDNCLFSDQSQLKEVCD